MDPNQPNTAATPQTAPAASPDLIATPPPADAPQTLAAPSGAANAAAVPADAQTASLPTPDALSTPPLDAAHDFGFASFLSQADYIILTVLGILLLMSIVSWFIILNKGLQAWGLRRRAGQVTRSFWEEKSLTQALANLTQRGSDDVFTQLAQAGAGAAQHYRKQSAKTLGEACDISDFITRALRQSIETGTARLEGGLTALASVGSTAPFVGLFGTVWGIYHALIRIGVTGQASLEQVAGPVGEALIMTAVGLAVAIPAVLAYNAFVRANRTLLTQLDGFAFDLHAYLTTGARVAEPDAARPTDASVTNLQTAKEITA
jgi:biopolymer transport protein ExbB